MNGRQPLQQEVLMTIRATPNEIIALNHVVQAFLCLHQGKPAKMQGNVPEEVVPLLERFSRRIGGGLLESEQHG